MTGNLENPVFFARAMMSHAVSLRCTASTLVRGVITSIALREENSIVRESRVAVSSSSKPCKAERCTRLESSSAVREADSSSLGSMPIARKIRLALPLRNAMNGRNVQVKATCSGTRTRAVCRGTERA